MREDEVQAHMRVCSRHFPDGNASSTPDTTLGKRLSSPKKGPRAKRAKKREESKQLRFRDARCVRAYKVRTSYGLQTKSSMTSVVLVN